MKYIIKQTAKATDINYLWKETRFVYYFGKDGKIFTTDLRQKELETYGYDSANDAKEAIETMQKSDKYWTLTYDVIGK